MPSVTIFDPRARYIFLPIFVTDTKGRRHEFDALLDTGAPMTEFSDIALQYAGLLDVPPQDVPIEHSLQTHKYGRIVLPAVEICSQALSNLNVYVSRFEKSWGIKALIGLDFFRRFRVTIDYQQGHLLTEPL